MSHLMGWQAPPENDQRAIRVPRGVLILAATLLAIHFCVQLVSPALWQDIYLFAGLFPERFSGAVGSALTGGWGHGMGTLLSYNFLHGSWEHVGMNVLWLVAFGAPIAKRMGSVRFFLLFLLSGMIGGLAEVLTSAPDHILVPIVGASAGVAGLLGGACRFAFSSAHRRAPWPSRLPLLGYVQTLKQPSALAIIAVWLVINLFAAVLGPSGLMSPDGLPVHVAWVAHLAGFVGGYFAIGLVDRPPLSLSGGVGRVDYGSWR